MIIYPSYFTKETKKVENIYLPRKPINKDRRPINVQEQDSPWGDAMGARPIHHLLTCPSFEAGSVNAPEVVADEQCATLLTQDA